MKALSWWLMFVGMARLSSVWFGFFDIWALRLAVFSQANMTEVHGRTFGVWTLLTCTLCFMCAFNLDNGPLYLVTLLSFFYALGHFLTEYLIYHTMAIVNLATVTFFAVKSKDSTCIRNGGAVGMHSQERVRPRSFLGSAPGTAAGAASEHQLYG